MYIHYHRTHPPLSNIPTLAQLYREPRGKNVSAAGVRQSPEAETAARPAWTKRTNTPSLPDNHTCPQPIDIVVHYDYYCPGSTIDSSTGVKYPCPFPTQSESSAGFDYNDPWYDVAPTPKRKKKRKSTEGRQTHAAFVTAQPATASSPPSAPRVSAGWPNSAAAGRAACAAGAAIPLIGVSQQTNQTRAQPHNMLLFPLLSFLSPTAVSGYRLYPPPVCTTRED